MIYDLFTADSIARHLKGAVSCVQCKMMFVPTAARAACPFCEIFCVTDQRLGRPAQPKSA